uniref:diacylglycerol O-acyltransferase n=1 Tax=Myxobolus squamalis TaxID=59785 RepID=A0A6B2G3K8_MYXSQ
MIVELLHLSLYTNICWLLVFYIVFHCWLNIVAELLKFGDRRFYFDWWNATSIAYFWRTWNIPVHQWCKRHVLNPVIKMGLNKFLACTMVFVLSGVFHEYLASMFFNMLNPWSFLIMICQIPSSLIVSLPRQRRVKNMVVWMMLIFSQGFGVSLYAYNFREIYGSTIFTFGIDAQHIINSS